MTTPTQELRPKGRGSAARSQRAWSLGDVALRGLKVGVRSAARFTAWGVGAKHYPRPLLAEGDASFSWVLRSQRVPLAGSGPLGIPELEDGKRRNLALAAPAFDGLLLPAGRPLSFWRTLGPTSRARGFRDGISLAEGCIVPTPGGGICLLSNALFRCAAWLGWDVLERHGHSAELVPPVTGELWGLDATVFWPYVDLVMAPLQDALMRCRVEADALVLEVHGREPLRAAVEIEERDRRTAIVGGEAFRTNELLRRVVDRRTGRSSEEVLAVNRKRIARPDTPHRDCLHCGETTCRARPKASGDPR